MKVAVQTWNGWHVILVEGEFVVKYLVEIRHQLESFEKQSNPMIAFDLTGTTYIDSSAITLLLNYQKRLKERNGNIVIFGANSDTRSIFAIVGLDSSITVFETREEFEKFASR